jgi:ribosomal protein L11 methyltransferase
MKRNRWLKVTVVADPRLLEPLSDFLVGVVDAAVESAAVDEPRYGTINAYLARANPNDEEVAQVLARISSFLTRIAEVFAVPLPELSWSMIEEEDWGKTWKEHFQPFFVIPGLVISPTWIEYQPLPGEKVLTMDPGMAFGTGHHPTTSLCLETIAACLPELPRAKVLDVGTGTGILGMAALLFGAESVTALDNDPEAVRAAEENIARNRLGSRMDVGLAPLASLPPQGYQLVVVNIVHDVLLALADDLKRVVAPGGNLVLSGIMVGEQLENIERHYLALGFSVLDRKSQGEWAALRLAKG